VPMIDYRAYLDASGNVHDSGRSYVTRARLTTSNGNADNQVILVSSEVGTGAGLLANIEQSLMPVMDKWLDNIAADRAPARNQAEKIPRKKPVGLIDACYTVTGDKITALAACGQMYPPQRNPRLVAGEPLTNDMLKCRLQPVSRLMYAQSFSNAQFTR